MPANPFRICLAQINPTVGDLEGNTRRIVESLEEARALGADLVAYPELAITGYPPEDLLLKTRFLRGSQRALERIQAATRGITAVVGFVECSDETYNAAAVLHDGQLAGVHRKVFLPNYGVFDEDRYFLGGRQLSVFQLGALTFGVGICEDIWYPRGPGFYQSLAGGAHLLINLNASPFQRDKRQVRERMLATRASDNACFVAYVNNVGGQDELVFDGASQVVGPSGQLLARAPQFEEALLTCDLELEGVLRRRLTDPRRRKGLSAFAPQGSEERPPKVDRIALEAPPSRPDPRPAAPTRSEPIEPTEWAEIHGALVLGLRDYVDKNRFGQVWIGISGGVDSALVAALAVEALGPDRVQGVYMPSRFSSQMSTEDSEALCRNLGIRLRTLPIEGALESHLEILGESFQGLPPDLAEENLQARIRGNLLMALSNKLGGLVLTTGNKSEVAVGYCTLYGDMAGGFAVLKDVFKTWVYALCRWINRAGEVIPERILTRPPSAELRPDQRDTDSLPPYEILDEILRLYVEEDLSVDGMIAAGFEAEVVHQVVRLVDRSEYKRRQAPPGVKITAKAFGRDWRVPLTNRFDPTAPI